RLERALEDRGVGLPLADLGREDCKVQPLGDAHLLEIPVEKPAGIERVRDEPELEATVPERLEQSVRVTRQSAGRLPGGVLRFEESAELLVVDRDVEVPEQLLHEPGI